MKDETANSFFLAIAQTAEKFGFSVGERYFKYESDSLKLSVDLLAAQILSEFEADAVNNQRNR